jgi:4-amino-4-deoxy-L-arabinose transferase-like glycosyltransferase
VTGRAALAAIVVVAFAARIAWIAYARFTPSLSDDAGRYDLLGRSLADAAGFVNPNGTTTMFWPPGYPFLLAAIYKLWPASLLGDHEVTVALVVNAGLAAATVALTYAIGRHVGGKRAGLIAAALLALCPSMVFFAGVTLSETLFTFVLMLALWCAMAAEERGDWRWLAACGIALGYGSLVRGQAALLVVALVPFWIASRHAGAGGDAERWFDARGARAVVAKMVAVGALTLVAIAPWTLRNWRVSGSPVLISTNAGVNFYIGHSPGADGAGRIVDELVFRYPELPQAEAEARINGDGFREGLRYAAHHPLREVSLSAKKVWWLYYRDDEALRWTDGHGERHVMPDGVRSALAALSNAYYWLLGALALLGLRRWFSARDPARVLLVAVVAYWTLVHVAFFADPRFHAPVMPVLCVWAACGVDAIASLVRRESRSA